MTGNCAKKKKGAPYHHSIQRKCRGYLPSTRTMYPSSPGSRVGQSNLQLRRPPPKTPTRTTNPNGNNMTGDHTNTNTLHTTISPRRHVYTPSTYGDSTRTPVPPPPPSSSQPSPPSNGAAAAAGVGVVGPTRHESLQQWLRREESKRQERNHNLKHFTSYIPTVIVKPSPPTIAPSPVATSPSSSLSPHRPPLYPDSIRVTTPSGYDSPIVPSSFTSSPLRPPPLTIHSPNDEDHPHPHPHYESNVPSYDPIATIRRPTSSKSSSTPVGIAASSELASYDPSSNPYDPSTLSTFSRTPLVIKVPLASPISYGHSSARSNSSNENGVGGGIFESGFNHQNRSLPTPSSSASSTRRQPSPSTSTFISPTTLSSPASTTTNDTFILRSSRPHSSKTSCSSNSLQTIPSSSKKKNVVPTLTHPTYPSGFGPMPTSQHDLPQRPGIIREARKNREWFDHLVKLALEKHQSLPHSEDDFWTMWFEQSIYDSENDGSGGGTGSSVGIVGQRCSSMTFEQQVQHLQTCLASQQFQLLFTPHETRPIHILLPTMFMKRFNLVQIATLLYDGPLQLILKILQTFSQQGCRFENFEEFHLKLQQSIHERLKQWRIEWEEFMKFQLQKQEEDEQHGQQQPSSSFHIRYEAPRWQQYQREVIQPKLRELQCAYESFEQQQFEERKMMLGEEYFSPINSRKVDNDDDVPLPPRPTISPITTFGSSSSSSLRALHLYRSNASRQSEDGVLTTRGGGHGGVERPVSLLESHTFYARTHRVPTNVFEPQRNEEKDQRSEERTILLGTGTAGVSVNRSANRVESNRNNVPPSNHDLWLMNHGPMSTASSTNVTSVGRMMDQFIYDPTSPSVEQVWKEERQYQTTMRERALEEEIRSLKAQLYTRPVIRVGGGGETESPSFPSPSPSPSSSNQTPRPPPTHPSSSSAPSPSSAGGGVTGSSMTTSTTSGSPSSMPLILPIPIYSSTPSTFLLGVPTPTNHPHDTPSSSSSSSSASSSFAKHFFPPTTMMTMMSLEAHEEHAYGEDDDEEEHEYQHVHGDEEYDNENEHRDHEHDDPSTTNAVAQREMSSSSHVDDANPRPPNVSDTTNVESWARSNSRDDHLRHDSNEKDTSISSHSSSSTNVNDVDRIEVRSSEVKSAPLQLGRIILPKRIRRTQQPPTSTSTSTQLSTASEPNTTTTTTTVATAVSNTDDVDLSPSVAAPSNVGDAESIGDDKTIVTETESESIISQPSMVASSNVIDSNESSSNDPITAPPPTNDTNANANANHPSTVGGGVELAPTSSNDPFESSPMTKTTPTTDDEKVEPQLESIDKGEVLQKVGDDSQQDVTDSTSNINPQAVVPSSFDVDATNPIPVADGSTIVAAEVGGGTVSPAKEHATVKIQTQIRGYLARKKVEIMKKMKQITGLDQPTQTPTSNDIGDAQSTTETQESEAEEAKAEAEVVGEADAPAASVTTIHNDDDSNQSPSSLPIDVSNATVRPSIESPTETSTETEKGALTGAHVEAGPTMTTPIQTSNSNIEDAKEEYDEIDVAVRSPLPSSPSVSAIASSHSSRLSSAPSTVDTFDPTPDVVVADPSNTDPTGVVTSHPITDGVDQPLPSDSASASPPSNTNDTNTTTVGTIGTSDDTTPTMAPTTESQPTTIESNDLHTHPTTASPSSDPSTEIASNPPSSSTPLPPSSPGLTPALASLKIQSAFRGYRARKKVRAMRSAAGRGNNGSTTTPAAEAPSPAAADA